VSGTVQFSVNSPEFFATRWPRLAWIGEMRLKRRFKIVIRRKHGVFAGLSDEFLILWFHSLGGPFAFCWFDEISREKLVKASVIHCGFVMNV
jgi:hypothetical protein